MGCPRNRVNSMEAFEGWVDQSIADRARAGLRQERPQQRLRLSEFPDYLKVYDLRSEGKRFNEIAKALWPRVDDLEKRARDYYQRGQALVLNPPLKPKRRPTRLFSTRVEGPT